MVDISANSTVYPSANDIAETEKEGRYATEQSHTELLQLWVKSHIVSGFVLPASDPDLTITVPSGEAVIDGHRVVVSASTDIALSPSNTNHIWLQLSFDGDGNVDGVDMISTTSGSPVANAVKIGEAVTGPGSVTSTTDLRNFIPYLHERVYGPNLDVVLGDTGLQNDTISGSPGVWDYVTAGEFTVTREQLRGRDTKVRSRISHHLDSFSTGGAGIEFAYRDVTLSADIIAIAPADLIDDHFHIEFIHTLTGASDHLLRPRWRISNAGWNMVLKQFHHQAIAIGDG